MKGMLMKKKVEVLFSIFLIFTNVQAGDIVVIGNSNVPKMDIQTVQKVYTGRFFSVDGVSVTPVSAKTGMPIRNRFLQDIMNQDEEKYTGYWTVRRYVGKGAPPNELGSTEEIINYVQSTPGGVGYIDEAELKAGINVVTRK
jgi:hypothetical protein